MTGLDPPSIILDVIREKAENRALGLFKNSKPWKTLQLAIELQSSLWSETPLSEIVTHVVEIVAKCVYKAQTKSCSHATEFEAHAELLSDSLDSKLIDQWIAALSSFTSTSYERLIYNNLLQRVLGDIYPGI